MQLFRTPFLEYKHWAFLQTPKQHVYLLELLMNKWSRNVALFYPININIMHNAHQINIYFSFVAEFTFTFILFRCGCWCCASYRPSSIIICLSFIIISSLSLRRVSVAVTIYSIVYLYVAYESMDDGRCYNRSFNDNSRIGLCMAIVSAVIITAYFSHHPLNYECLFD